MVIAGTIKANTSGSSVKKIPHIRLIVQEKGGKKEPSCHKQEYGYHYIGYW
jgi:hypothetical protein